ncbi:beta-lactamase-like protein [Lasiosphaeria miniovina]|uniref:Beta-lactamase-like protein n=1 Tax=Lasiosphaeria miniovina TaxID=1954250 RepID=A0AA40BH98_9PEZI|nr:beta-lactamase-like protein [Lasiosphaeria miniovina]KAK0734205.1 beta-lactamase-like protein [Lasiosphaeria miniovina]
MSSLLICTACGTQFPTADRAVLTTCFICDDPRQYIPPSGQGFTTMAELQQQDGQRFRNEFTPLASDPKKQQLISISTAPKFAIGQRAVLVRTPSGKNVLWDCVTLLDDDTAAAVDALGGLHAIVISHPHYYSTHADWAARFACPVYLADDDAAWIARRADEDSYVFVRDIETRIVLDGVDTGVTAIKLGGHFPGSLVLLFDQRLLIADTLMTTPAGLANWTADAAGQTRARPTGANSFAFMWSIPNMIPLSAGEVARMWDILQAYEFRSTHGAFVGQDIEDSPSGGGGVGVKARVLESMQIQVRAMGYADHPFLQVRLRD